MKTLVGGDVNKTGITDKENQFFYPSKMTYNYPVRKNSRNQ